MTAWSPWMWTDCPRSSSDGSAPGKRARAPASAITAPRMAPSSGRRTIAKYISALHQVDVFDRDRAAVAEIDHENGKPDRGFRPRNREQQQPAHLAGQITQMGRE